MDEENIPLTTKIIEATLAAKYNSPNALQLCDNVAKQLSSTKIDDTPIWTLPQEYKYIQSSPQERLQYCASGQFIEDVKNTTKGIIEKAKDVLDENKDIKDEMSKTVGKETKNGFTKIMILGAIGFAAYFIMKK